MICKAALSGSFLTTVTSFGGIISGLFLTHVVFTTPDDEEFETVPALPVPICLGMVFYFGTLYIMCPVLDHVLYAF